MSEYSVDDINPFKFFGLQFLCVLSWVFTLGGLTLVLLHGENMMMVLQGWSPLDLEIEVK